MSDLSVLIAARNEMFLNHTIQDVLAHSKANTEIIVVLDGDWSDEIIPQHPQVHVVYQPVSIGQRAAVNLAASMSRAEFICKLDAHVAVADGWDVELIRAARTLGSNVVQIPAQHNLHVFDWICEACGRRTYQGPTPTTCTTRVGERGSGCGKAGPFRRDIVWNAVRRRTETWCFDHTLHFQYDGRIQLRAEKAAKERGEQAPEFFETMSCLGACWFLSREYFWQLGGLDESLGSWGQMGQELACKTWLSGGRMMTNRQTWFSHLFRTQGLDFGFPYPQDSAQVTHARTTSQRIWLHNAWPQQVHPLRWLVEKFWPIKGWTQEQVDALPKELPHRASVTKGCIWYSDNRPAPEILRASQRSVDASGLPIVAVTLTPIDWPAARSIVLPLERGYLSMFRQILAGLEALDTDVVFFCEHDVLYAPDHFHFTPSRDDVYYYNLSMFKVDAQTGRAVTYETKQTSGLCGNRQLLIEHYRKRIARVEADGFSRKQGFEPGSHGRAERIDDVPSDVWRSLVPNLDIRHDKNLTTTRWSPSEFRSERSCRGWREVESVPGWGPTRGRMPELLQALAQPSPHPEAVAGDLRVAGATDHPADRVRVQDVAVHRAAIVVHA